MKFRKKPVEIEARQWKGGVEAATLIIEWVLENEGTARYHESEIGEFGRVVVPEHLQIDTLEGVMKANVDDYIIKGVKDEFYPCKPDIFEATYDTEEESPEVEVSAEFTTYIRKPFSVEALEITVENIHELSDLIGEFKEDETGPYIEPDPERVPTVTRVVPGYFVTKMGRNVRCYSPRVFNEQFTPMTASLDRLMRKVQEESNA